MSIIDSLTGQSDKTADTHALSPTPERLRKNERIAIITGDNVEDTEFFYPYYRLAEEGYGIDVITINGGKFTGKHGLGLKDSKRISETKAEDYALLYLPGGKAPASLRENQEVLDFVRAIAASGKPIAAICHGPQILISAGLAKGRQMAAWPEIAEELREAGATFVDEALVEDEQFITARKPGDLPRHLYGVLQALQGKLSGESRDARRSHAA
jgi:protease I